MIQTIIVAIMVIGAVVYLGYRYLGKKTKSTCGSCNACQNSSPDKK